MINLTDLDELVLNIREETARSYIREAIQAYRAGAYRASVISTWIAVVFDIIAKIRYLSNQNERSAVTFINDLDRFSKELQPHINKLLEIERNILDTAKEQFEFLAIHEYRDLKRLQEDRHLCAHPALITEDTLFQPTPELVRVHIVHAVTYLLQHQPVQGKSAINLILDDINKQYFPDNLEKTCDFLNIRYLNRAKDSFIKNLIYVLLINLLSQDH